MNVRPRSNFQNCINQKIFLLRLTVGASYKNGWSTLRLFWFRSEGQRYSYGNGWFFLLCASKERRIRHFQNSFLYTWTPKSRILGNYDTNFWMFTDFVINNNFKLPNRISNQSFYDHIHPEIKKNDKLLNQYKNEWWRR